MYSAEEELAQPIRFVTIIQSSGWPLQKGTMPSLFDNQREHEMKCDVNTSDSFCCCSQLVRLLLPFLRQRSNYLKRKRLKRMQYYLKKKASYFFCSVFPFLSATESRLLTIIIKLGAIEYTKHDCKHFVFGFD